ncbi:MAG: polysaccharide biosynthesis C-terminal domain-containing protein [Oscillospiraceae bacterium]|nr:polysaccharide biosynthesis C-terminal domain-containing protein [Oscillospiraceae bacterium]MBQ8881447.1 polysaccharide biosynthesis C-terminal domain-containing protein [Oscillospiraceae bacterium]
MGKKLPIFYNALLLTGVNLLLRFVSTGFQVYLSGTVGAAGIGLLQLVLSVGSLALTAGMAGIRTATMYLTAEELGKRRPENVCWVLSGCVGYSILCSGTVAVLLYCFAPNLAAGWIGESGTVGAVRLLAYFLPVNCLCGVMIGYFTAANRIGTLAAVEVAEQGCSMILTVSLLRFWAGSDLSKACAAVILGSAVSGCLTLLCLVILRAREGSPMGQRILVARRLWETAVPLALADDLKSGISTAENLMVPKRLALCQRIGDPLAAFGTVCGMVFPVLMFPMAILYGLAELLIPELARCAAAGSHKRIRYLAKRSLRLAMLYGCLFCGLLYLLSDELCIGLYRNPDAGVYLRRFALLAPMLYCDAITDAMIKGLGQQTACVRYNILSSGMDVAFLYLLLPTYGMEGYFFSFLVTHIINFFLSVRRLLKLTGKLISPTVPILALLATAFSVLLAGTLSAPIPKAVAYILLLGCLWFLLRVVSREDVRWLKGLVRKK